MLYINGFASTSSTNKWKAFFQISNSISNYWAKQKIIERITSVDIDQSAMCYISMDWSRQAKQNNGIFFSNFEIIFKLLPEKNIQMNSEESILIQILYFYK